jgi:LmbE family N-acetylglucosaminyl deacetylase
MMKKIFVVLLALMEINMASGQASPSWTSADMYLALRKLNVLGSVLYVAAHPDDENTRLISYFSKDRMYRTGYLSLTRGDGGQNLIGDEQGVELGLIRTQELLSARRIDGGEQFFSRAFDFGFSKNPTETFSKWDKEKILSDVVWVIRKFQPDVIITRFPTTGEGGHGHHTASAILANEAFTAAADPKRFPEQLQYVNVWQAKRILWNSFNFGGTDLTSNDQFKFDVGGYNPLLGKSYGEIAAESRSNHKSQGFGSAANRGEAMEFFKTTGGTAPSSDLMDDVDISWNRVAGGAAISKMIEGLASSFDLLHPEKSVEGLVALYKDMGKLRNGYWRDKKRAEVMQLIVQCSGLFMDVTSSDQFAIQTDSIRFNFAFNNRLGADAVLQRVTIDQFDTTLTQALVRNRNFNFSKSMAVPMTKAITQPYWLANKMEEGYFNVKDQLSIGQADVDPSYTAQIGMKIYGETFVFSRPVKYKFTDPVRGELYEPLVVLPPLLVAADERYKMSRDDNKFNGVLTVTSKKKNVSADIEDFGVQAKDQATVKFTPSHLSFSERNKSYPIEYKAEGTVDNDYNFWVTADGRKTVFYQNEMKEIKYDHIPYINYFKDVTVTNRKLDLKIYNKRIGYIVGAGDKVPEALEQMGYDVVLLGDKELSRNNLSQYDAIITGVRAYNTNEWMNKHYDRLMKYVEDGGNLIVQYNTSNNIGPIRAKMGPYDFNVTRTRVTDENATVNILKPDHPVLNFPNKIGPDDFKGWVQERSIYHASGWDKSKFETIFSMNDPGEAADEGSLIISKYGKGYFTYTGLVFFRELPAGVPGGYRLFANIIALNKKKAF